MPERTSRPFGPERTSPPLAPEQPADPVHDGPAGAADLEVQVVPRAAHSRVVGPHAGRLKVQLAAPPVDGAANAALVDLLADALDVAKHQVTIVRGHTGRRKTVRIADLTASVLRARLGLINFLYLPLVASLLAAPACESEVPFSIKVVLPDDTDSLARANNAALALSPGGSENFEIDGLDFSIEVKLEPDDTQRTLSLYLAEGENLLAWGRSAPFILSAPVDGLAVLIAPPGQLSSFRGTITEPDPEILVGVAPGRGAFMLDDEGHAALLNEFTLESDIAATLTADDLPPADDGALVPDTGGGIWRLAWAERLRGFRYDPGDDEWTIASHTGADTGARPGAAHVVDASLERLLLFGGGSHADIAQVDLVAASDGGFAVEILTTPLDGPRRGATALYVTREDSDDGEGVVLVGGDDPTRPLAYFVATGQAFGAPEAWTGLQCAQLERSPGADDEVRVLCVGGLRGAAATTAALVLHFPPASEAKDPSLEIVPDLVPDAPADPRLLADDRYLYAQYAGPGGGHWLRIDRADLTTTSEPGPALRARGGHSVSLGTGATFLLGGWTADDTAVDRWHVFVGSISTE